MVLRKSTAVVSAILLAVVATLLYGCGSGSGGLEKTSRVSLQLKWPANYSFNSKTSQLSFTSSPKMMSAPDYVTGCRVTISGADMESITMEVPLSTGQLNGSVTPGERRFDVMVDTQFGISFTGSTTVTLVPGDNGDISVDLSVNSEPIMNGITFSPGSPKKNETVALSVSITDQDITDIQNITWDGGGGRIFGSGSSVTWVADRGGVYTVTVTADDGRGGVVNGNAVITVTNTPPTISYVTTDNTSATVGDVVNVSCSATDADGDPLSYSWSDGYGWSASGAAAQYKVTSTLVSSLTCFVDDGDTNGKVSGSVSVAITVNPLTGLFTDANLATCVTTVFPSATTAGQVTGTMECPSYTISDLSGIENLTGLTSLGLGLNQIVDVTPLASLTGLTSLWLGLNQIVDVTPLASLTGLTILGLSSNQIVDVTPLASLTGLTILALPSNQLADVTPLAGLTGLTILALASNQLVDVTPLAGLTGLTYLDMSRNQLVDVTPLAGLTGLTILDLAYNGITTGVNSLAGLTSAAIYLSGNIGMSCLELQTLICGAGNTVVSGVCSPAATGLGTNVEISFNAIGNIDTPTPGVNCTSP
jgi:hypothetical protein